MKKTVVLTAIFVTFAAVALANAQPKPMEKPAPMVATMAPAMAPAAMEPRNLLAGPGVSVSVVTGDGMGGEKRTLLVPAKLPPATMVPALAMAPADKPPMPNVMPAMAPAPAAAMVPAMAPAPVAPAMAVTAPATPAKVVVPPKAKTAKFWIAIVVTPILTMVCTLLLMFGVFKPQWSKWMRDKQVYTIADKVCNQVEAFADDGKVDWKDALAQSLRAVVSRLGQLSTDEEAKVTAVVDDRREQAEAKEKKDS